jgi:hypothetical protein
VQEWRRGARALDGAGRDEGAEGGGLDDRGLIAELVAPEALRAPPARKPPPKASPAPMVSTTSTSSAGTGTSPVPVTTRTPVAAAGEQHDPRTGLEQRARGRGRVVWGSSHVMSSSETLTTSLCPMTRRRRRR